MKKRYVYIFFLSLIILSVYAQTNTMSSIANSVPIAEIQTYSRYDSATDNFPETNFFICIGEQNRTINIRILAQDNNSNTEILNGGNLTFKVVSITNNTEFDIPSFGSAFIEPDFESSIGLAELSYITNITLTNSSAYRVLTNVSDVHNTTSQNSLNFTVNNTNCIRVDQNANLVANQTHNIIVNFSELSIVVNENITGRIIVTEFNQSPVDNNVLEALDRYVKVDVVGPIKNVTINLTLTVNYSESNFNNKLIEENSMDLYKWNGTAWNITPGSINTENNTVTFLVQGTKDGIANISLGVFSIRGAQQVITNPIQNPTGGGQSRPGSGSEAEEGGEAPIEQDESREDKKDEEDQGNESGIDRTQGTVSSSGNIQEKTLFPRLFGRISMTHSFCWIIILILFLLWIITLILWLNERRKNKEERKRNSLRQMQR